MIFTRRFGALRARPTFPSTDPVMDIEEYEAQRRLEEEAERVAGRGSREGSHPRFLHFHFPPRRDGKRPAA